MALDERVRNSGKLQFRSDVMSEQCAPRLVSQAQFFLLDHVDVSQANALEIGWSVLIKQGSEPEFEVILETMPSRIGTCRKGERAGIKNKCPLTIF